jgi:hypothetical protein
MKKEFKSIYQYSSIANVGRNATGFHLPLIISFGFFLIGAIASEKILFFSLGAFFGLIGLNIVSRDFSGRKIRFKKGSLCFPGWFFWTENRVKLSEISSYEIRPSTLGQKLILKTRDGKSFRLELNYIHPSAEFLEELDEFAARKMYRITFFKRYRLIVMGAFLIPLIIFAGEHDIIEKEDVRPAILYYSLLCLVQIIFKKSN